MIHTSIFDSDSREPGVQTASELLASVPADLLQETIASCLTWGWLISFGSSRDLGAVSVAVINEQGKDRKWAGDVGELEDALQAVHKATNDGRAWSAQLSPSEAPEGPSTGGSGQQARGGKSRKQS